jgi:hypothetical protein
MQDTELDVLRDVSRRLAAAIDFMLTGSVAMNYYAQPRMTRDIDLVVALNPGDAETVVRLFEPDYYVSPEAVVCAIADIQPHPPRERDQGRLHRTQERTLPAGGVCAPSGNCSGRFSDLECQPGRPDPVQALLGEGFKVRDAAAGRNLLMAECEMDYLRSRSQMRGVDDLLSVILLDDE